MLEHIRSLIFKCEFVGAVALVPNELRIYYALFDVYWVRTFVVEVSMSISGFCIYASGWCRQTIQRHLDTACWMQMTLM